MTKHEKLSRREFVISAATDPVAGIVPSTLGPEGSGFVAMNRAPPSISRTARVIASNE